jgi:hypothetical protein
MKHEATIIDSPLVEVVSAGEEFLARAHTIGQSIQEQVEHMMDDDFSTPASYESSPSDGEDVRLQEVR